MDKKETTEKPIEEAKLVEVPTGSELAIQLESGEFVNSIGIFVKIYNKLLKIEKAIA